MESEGSLLHCPPPVPIQNQLDPVHTPTSHFLKVILKVSSHLRLDLPGGLFLSWVPTKTMYRYFLRKKKLLAVSFEL
jgi:hypothetical protein